MLLHRIHSVVTVEVRRCYTGFTASLLWKSGVVTQDSKRRYCGSQALLHMIHSVITIVTLYVECRMCFYQSFIGCCGNHGKRIPNINPYSYLQSAVNGRLRASVIGTSDRLGS